MGAHPYDPRQTAGRLDCHQGRSELRTGPLT